MSEWHPHIDRDNTHDNIPYREEYADAALHRYRKSLVRRQIIRFSILTLLLIGASIGLRYAVNSATPESIATLETKEAQPINTQGNQSPTHGTDELTDIITHLLPEDIQPERKAISKKFTHSPKNSTSASVYSAEEGSELEYPAVGLSASVSSGTGVSERQPELISDHSTRSTHESIQPLQMKWHNLTVAPEMIQPHREIPIAVSRFKPYLTLGIGGYSTLGVAKFKDPTLTAGMDYHMGSGNLIYASARVYSITGLDNPYVSSQITYTSVSHETRTTYQTERLYMGGLDVGAGHRFGPYLLKAGLVADYLITGDNTLIKEQRVNHQVVSSETQSARGYVKGYRDLTFAANLGISRQITSTLSAGASMQFGLQDITRNEVFNSGDRHINSVAQIFLKYQWQR